MINYWRHHWYYIGGILFVALAFFLIFFNDTLSRTQVILLASFMSMLIHQFEEYAWPGGFPSMANSVLTPGNKDYDRYPFNANQCFISNVFLTYAFYISAVLFPDMIWLGLAQVLAGVLQLFAHGIAINIRMKSFYNPGLGATVFLQCPIAAYYIYHINNLGLVSGFSVYIIGLIGAIAALSVLFFIPIKVMNNRNSKYPFYEEEIFGYAEEKMKKLINGEKI